MTHTHVANTSLFFPHYAIVAVKKRPFFEECLASVSSQTISKVKRAEFAGTSSIIIVLKRDSLHPFKTRADLSGCRWLFGGVESCL